MRIRDPIHGTIPVSDPEKAIIDSRHYQRLRHIRQLGFGDLAFPGATHTRHAHSLGAMHVASRLFDAVASSAELPEDVRARFCAAVRLAVLCHDLGHMPLSHASERIAPPRASLKLPAWLDATAEGPQATHEDFTAKILLDSSLTPLIEQALRPAGHPRGRGGGADYRGEAAERAGLHVPGRGLDAAAAGARLRRAGRGPDGLPAARLLLHGRQLRPVRPRVDHLEPEPGGEGRGGRTWR